MGNCQTADVATVEVQHPEKRKPQRIFWPISANAVMGSNPGYYVALVVPSPAGRAKGNNLKLLRPDEFLHIGHVYRLISFEDVIKDFTLKKSIKLGKRLNGGGVLDGDTNENSGAHGTGLGLDNKNQIGGGSRGVGRKRGSGEQWRPALQSIAEL